MVFKHSLCVVPFILLSTVQVLRSQAPVDSGCPVDIQNPTVLTLMDSYNYNNLIGSGGVWSTANGDSSSATWGPGSGGNCQKTAQVCESRQWYFRAENWLFTQYIPRPAVTYDTTIFVNVTVRILTSCVSAGSCPRYVLVYKYVANDQQDGIAYKNTSRYSLIGNITSAVTLPFTDTVNFTLNAGETGFYIAFRDQGSCTFLNRVVVYNYQCPQKQVGLVALPLTSAPSYRNSRLAVSASCLPGSVNKTSLDYYCSYLGTWTGSASCVCRAQDGYKPTLNGCEGCGSGFYLDVSKATCRACPEHTMQSAEITSECSCSTGYFRAPRDLPSDDCTAPPHSAATDLVITKVTNSSLTVMWKYIPLPNERTDYYFELFYKTAADSIPFTYVAQILSQQNFTYTISGLIPNTNYIIMLITKNGVSDQDPENEMARTVTVSGKTTQEQAPGIVTDIVTIGRYVIWQPPSQSSGEVHCYKVKILRDTREKVFNVHETFYAVKDGDIPAGSGSIYVQVCTIIEDGYGEWSEKIGLGSSCPSAPPPSVPERLQLLSSESCVMWPVPNYEVTRYDVLHDGITTTLPRTTNWYCNTPHGNQNTPVQVRAVNSAGVGPFSSINLKTVTCSV